MCGCLDTCQFVPYTLDAGSKYNMVNRIIILFISVYEGLRLYAKMISLLVPNLTIKPRYWSRTSPLNILADISSGPIGIIPLVL